MFDQLLPCSMLLKMGNISLYSGLEGHDRVGRIKESNSISDAMAAYKLEAGWRVVKRMVGWSLILMTGV